MRLAISNLAWDRGQDGAVAGMMRKTGATGVELAPTKLWDEPLSAPDSEIAACRGFWESAGIEIASLQSLLFNRPDLELFSGTGTRADMLRYLSGTIELAAKLGARILVFGSPRNRQRHGLSDHDVASIAIPFFRSLGAHAVGHGVTFCIEPNPAEYGCDWITTSTEGLRFVESVNSEGFGLHLDAGGMTIAGEDAPAAISTAAKALKHFHISEPGLAPVGLPAAGGSKHSEFAQALKRANYSGWSSIEMVPAAGNALEGIERALSFSARLYG